MSDTEEDSLGSDSWPINEDWLIDMLRQHHETQADIKITDFSVKQGFLEGVSNLSDILSVSVIYEIPPETDKKLNIVIKLLPHDPFSRFFVTEAQFDLREIKFYTKILPDLLEFQEQHIKNESDRMLVSVPTCFYTQYSPGNMPTDGSPEPPESILVLEDMRPLGFRAAHFTSGLTLRQAESAIIAISSIHSLSLGLKFKNKVDLNEKYPFLFQITKATESYQQLVEQGMPQLLKFLEQKGGYDSEIEALESVRSKTRKLIENLLHPVEPIGLITHTDFWCNNLLFKDDSKDDNCIILDWQMVTYSRPTNDIALLITSSLPSEIRRENTQKLLDLYYSHIKKNCSKLKIDLEVDLQYSRNKLECDFRQSQLLALLLCIGSVDVAIGNTNAEQRLLDVLRDFYQDGILNFEEM